MDEAVEEIKNKIAHLKVFLACGEYMDEVI